MPHRVRTGARVRCATVLVLAALMLVPTAVAAATPSTAKATIEGAGGTEAAEVGLPDDPVQADLGRTLGSLDARIEAKQAEAAVAARTLADARAKAEAEAAAAHKAAFVEETQERLAEEMEEAQTVGDTDRQAEVKARLDELAAIVEAPKRGADTRKAKAEADARAKAKADADAAAAKAKADAEAAAQAKAEAALRPVPVGRPTGTYPAVPCPGGGSITIDGSLAHNLNAMLLAARNDGINLCGGGYRDPNRQIQLRIQNCGSSTYAIYQMPPGSCLPPTAIPGTSSHERGLAIDFRCAGQGIPTRSSPCFQWMAAHAAGFGFFNLPSEPWHWSTTGS